jgi:uncharacterized repeat protein (TIGR01451 family)
MRRTATPRRRLLLLAAFALLAFAQSASAQNMLYHIRGNAGGNNNIWAINPATGVQTLVYANYPGGNAATIAQRPSDGMIFYVINGTNGQVYRFNPATPGVAPVAIGPIGPATNTGAAVSGGFRMAFGGNTLYYMIGNAGTDANSLYTVNQTTGRATRVSGVNLTNNGGDIAFNGSTLFIVDQNRNLFTSTTLTGNATAAGTITFPSVSGTAPNIIGIAFIAGQMYVQTVGDAAAKTALWSVTGTTAASVTQIGGGNSATGDLASATVTPPNLSISKTVNSATVYRGGPISYTINVTNLGTYAVTGTVSDNVPASVTGVTWACSVSAAPSFCASANGSGNNISTSATLEPGASATYTVSGTVSASAATGTLTNTANVAVPSWLTDSNTANNTASADTNVTLNANLGVTKTDGLANVNPGQTVTYTVVVSNAGPDASNGSVFTDTVPAALSGVTWTCGSPTGGAACGAANGSGNSISTTANLPANSSVTYTVNGTLSATATGTLSNTATVLTPASGVTDPNDPTRTGANNNSATDTTTINLVPDLGIAKSHAGDFTRGLTGSYTLTVSNSGTGPTTAPVTVTDTLPAGLQPTGPTGNVGGWTCNIAGQTVTCTRSNALAAGQSYPSITVTVNVLQTAPASVTNTASVAGGGGDISAANNSDDDPTNVVSSADLSLTKTAGNPSPGINQSVTFTVTVSNAGPSNATGVAVSDQLPAGLAFVSATPSAGAYDQTTGVWSVGDLASATSATLQIVATVTTHGAFTNTAQVIASGQPDPDSTPNNNNAAEDDQASAALNVAAPPAVALCKTFPGQTCDPPPSLPDQLPGADITYVITFTNTGGSAAQSFRIIDPLPASTDFKLGSTAANLGTTGLTVVFEYSNDGGLSYAYTPASGAGGAPAGYDRTVTHVRWVFSGALSQTSPNNAGSVQFAVRIR